MRDIPDNLRIANSYLLGVMAPDKFEKQLLQRMRLWNHLPVFIFVHGPMSSPITLLFSSYRNKPCAGLNLEFKLNASTRSSHLPLVRSSLWALVLRPFLAASEWDC